MRFLILFLLFINVLLLGQLVGFLPTLVEDSADKKRLATQVSPDMARVIALEAPPPPVPLGTPLSGPNAPASITAPAPLIGPPPILPPSSSANAPASTGGLAAPTNSANSTTPDITAPTVTAPTAAGNLAVAPIQTPSGPAAVVANAALACLEVGPVAGSTAQVIQANLIAAPLAISSQFFRQDGRPDDQASYMVILEGATNPKEAQAREQQARSLGARDAFIVPDGPNKYAVSLGIFRAPEAANSVVSALSQRGLLGMRVISRPGAAKVIVKVPNITADKVDAVRSVLSGQPVKACTA
jgi:hypothetical protein